MQVHGALLDTLTALSADATKDFASVAGKHALLATYAPALADAGAPPAAAGERGDECDVVPAASADGEAAAALALGGVDPVLFVRHGGLLCTASRSVACARVPADGGLLCAIICSIHVHAPHASVLPVSCAANAVRHAW